MKESRGEHAEFERVTVNVCTGFERHGDVLSKLRVVSDGTAPEPEQNRHRSRWKESSVVLRLVTNADIFAETLNGEVGSSFARILNMADQY